MSYIAERTSSSANVSEDHKCGGSIAETLTDIGTGRLLADSVQPVFSEDILELQNLGCAGKLCPDPGRFSEYFAILLRLESNRDTACFVSATIFDAGFQGICSSHGFSVQEYLLASGFAHFNVC